MEALTNILQQINVFDVSIVSGGIGAIALICKNWSRWFAAAKNWLTPKPSVPPISYVISNCENVTIIQGNDSQVAINPTSKNKIAGNEENTQSTGET